FCAHPLILHLLGLDEEQAGQVRSDMLNGNKAAMPGLVRASFGLYNSTEEIDHLAAALSRIAQGDYAGDYQQDKASGEYHPTGWQPNFEDYFSL
ncbi:MAG: aminotransferase, partial [Anaerolineae bacterium]|nr:aminotransferase [Anaerolineae bacterium]